MHAEPAQGVHEMRSTPAPRMTASASTAEAPPTASWLLDEAGRIVELHRLVRIGRVAINESREPEEVDRAIEHALGLIGEFRGVDRAYVFRYRKGLRRLDNTHEWCAPGISAQIDELQDLDSSMAEEWTRAFLRGDHVHMQDVADYPDEQAELRRVLTEQGIISIVVYPLRAGGDLIGFVGFDYVQTSAPMSVEDLEVLAMLADSIALALSRRDYADLLHHSERYDHLTGLLRREPFIKLLSDERFESDRSSDPATLCVVDIDGFGDLNDRHGWRGGDEILRTTAQRIVDAAGGTDLAARLGNDTFALLTREPTSPTAAAELVTRVSHACSADIPLGDVTVPVTVSVGLAMDGPSVTEGRDLLHRGEAALREAKALRGRRGPGTIVAFEPELERRVNERIALGDALSSPTANAGLWTVYQPCVDLVTRRIFGAETLARWDHPMTGLVPPDVFVPLAEQRGSIGQLTHSVASLALNDLRTRFIPAFGPGFALSINLSPRHLASPDFLHSCAATAADSGVSPRSVWLEVTESAEIVDEPMVIEHLAELRRQGFRVAIDDFGTGYSSFSRLRDLPIDGLKIDRSFVSCVHSDPVAQALVAAQVDIATMLGLQIIAEGVETDEQVASLLRLGVRYGQGFGLHHPMSAEDLTLLSEQKEGSGRSVPTCSEDEQPR